MPTEDNELNPIFLVYELWWIKQAPVSLFLYRNCYKSDRCIRLKGWPMSVIFKFDLPAVYRYKSTTNNQIRLIFAQPISFFLLDNQEVINRGIKCKPVGFSLSWSQIIYCVCTSDKSSPMISWLSSRILRLHYFIVSLYLRYSILKLNDITYTYWSV